jgi:hypothetical protein
MTGCRTGSIPATLILRPGESRFGTSRRHA